MKASIYLRQSLDRTGAGLAVDRQEAECRKLCRRLGFRVFTVYTDNDVSATSGEDRPEFERLLASAPEAIVSWHQDRLLRLGKDLERVIDIDVPVFFVMSSTLDLATPAGRAVARTVAAWTQYEIEQKTERQKLQHLQRVDAGKPWGNIRPFGYKDPQLSAIDPVEAEIVRQMYTDILAGRTQAEVCRDLNARGVTTTHGNAWRQASLRQLLVNPRNAGIIQHTTKDKKRKTKTVTLGGPGQWDAIVSESTWRATVAKLTPERPRMGGGKRTNLLSGLAMCGVCGAPMRAQKTRTGSHIYSCFDNFCVGRSQPALDEFISQLVIARLSQPDARDLVLTVGTGVDIVELQAEAAAIRQALDNLAGMYGAGDLPLSAFTAGTARANAQLAELTRVLTDAGRADRLGDLVGKPDVAEAWGELELERKRGVIDTLMAIRVLPTGKGARVFNPDHVDVQWRGDEGAPNRRPGPRPGHRVGLGTQGRVPGQRTPRRAEGSVS